MQMPPSDLQLSDLSPTREQPARQFSRTSSESSTNFATSRVPSSSSTDSSIGHSALMKRAGLPPSWANSPTPSDRTATMARSQTVSTFSPSSRLPTGIPTSTPRPPLASRVPTNASSTSGVSTSGTASKSRGVQMVSEMRARVRNLEQRLHTRVPRLRMGSISGKKAEALAESASTQRVSTSSPEFRTPENPRSRSKRRSADVEYERRLPQGTPNADSSGWVLIMEDNMTPSPAKDRDKARRRLSSPTSSPSPFSISSRSTNRTSSSKTSNTSESLTDMNIGKGRPQSQLSENGRDSMSTVSTASSLSTPTSRPTSPAFLSTPPPGSIHSALPTLKRSVTGGKRASLGKGSPSRAPPSFLQPPNGYRDRQSSVILRASANRSLPPSPPRMSVKSPRPPSALGQSRIGRPTSLTSGRRSAGDDKTSRVLSAKDLGRWRSGSAA